MSVSVGMVRNLLDRHCLCLCLREALDRRQRLAAVALLDTDVNVVLLRPNVVLHVKRVSLVGEGVYGRANERIVCQQRC